MIREWPGSVFALLPNTCPLSVPWLRDPPLAAGIAVSSGCFAGADAEPQNCLGGWFLARVIAADERPRRKDDQRDPAGMTAVIGPRPATPLDSGEKGSVHIRVVGWDAMLAIRTVV